MLKDGVERRRGPGALRHGGMVLIGMDKLFAGVPRFPSYATAHGTGLPN